MAVLSDPSNTPTLDGTTAVCVSDDATGTVYLSVRTDRQWYSVANGDSQGLADADKATIIAGTTDSNIVFADNQAASADPEQLIDGLAARLDPANPYYVGWVQEVAATLDPVDGTDAIFVFKSNEEASVEVDGSNNVTKWVEQVTGGTNYDVDVVTEDMLTTVFSKRGASDQHNGVNVVSLTNVAGGVGLFRQSSSNIFTPTDEAPNTYMFFGQINADSASNQYLIGRAGGAPLRIYVDGGSGTIKIYDPILPGYVDFTTLVPTPGNPFLLVLRSVDGTTKCDLTQTFTSWQTESLAGGNPAATRQKIQIGQSGNNDAALNGWVGCVGIYESEMSQVEADAMMAWFKSTYGL